MKVNLIKIKQNASLNCLLIKIQMEVQEEQLQLYHGERVFERNINCIRRYCPPGLDRSNGMNYNELKQSVTITNYRLIFKGETHPDLTMSLTFNYVKSCIIPTKNPLFLGFELSRSYGSKNEPTRVVLKFQEPSVPKEIMALVKKECIDSVVSDSNQSKLKMQELISDSVRYNIYMNLVHEKKLLTEDDFWKNDELLQMNYRNIREEFDKNNQRIKVQTIMNKPKPTNIELETEPEFLRKEIQNMNLTPKPEDINNATREMLFKEIEDMYLNNSKFYEKFTKEQAAVNVNEGVKLVVKDKMEHSVQVHQIEPTIGAPLKIPDTHMKFEMKGDSLLTFLHRPKVKKGESATNNIKKETTRKVVEYVKMFYSCMANNSKEIANFEKEIRLLQKQIQEMVGCEDLKKFLQKSIQNYMKHRKENPHS